MDLSKACCLLAHGSNWWRCRLSLLPSLAPVAMSSSLHVTALLLLQLRCLHAISMATVQHGLAAAWLLGLHVTIACSKPMTGPFHCLRWQCVPMASLLMPPV